MVNANSLKAVEVLADVGTVIGEIIKDKGNFAEQLKNLLGLQSDVSTIMSIDKAGLMAELTKLDEAGKLELVNAFAAKFDLPHDQTEAHIEEALMLAMSYEALIERTIAFGKKLAKKDPA
jgi:hypothetical protein